MTAATTKLTTAVRKMTTTNETALVNREGRFAYFDFCDEDLMRSSSLRNSLVSSSIDLEGGLGGKGITSDMGRTSLGTRPRRFSFSRAIGAFLRRRAFRRSGICHNYSDSTSTAA